MPSKGRARSWRSAPQSSSANSQPRPRLLDSRYRNESQLRGFSIAAGRYLRLSLFFLSGFSALLYRVVWQRMKALLPVVLFAALFWPRFFMGVSLFI